MLMLKFVKNVKMSNQTLKISFEQFYKEIKNFKLKEFANFETK